MEAYDYLFKFLVVGETNVGKTSLLIRFVDGYFEANTRNTVGTDVKVKMLDVDNKRVRLTVWDTAGSERFRTLTSSYFRGAQAAVLVYDVTSRNSFNAISTWIEEVKLHLNLDETVLMLVGNKIDLEDERAVSQEEGLSFAQQHSMLFIEASAKTQQGVHHAFMEVVRKVVDKQLQKEAGRGGGSEGEEGEEESKSGRRTGRVDLGTSGGGGGVGGGICC